MSRQWALEYVEGTMLHQDGEHGIAGVFPGWTSPPVRYRTPKGSYCRAAPGAGDHAV